MEGMADRIRYKTRWLITRYRSEADFQNRIPGEVPDPNGPVGSILPAHSIIEGNVLLNEGITQALNLLIGANATHYDANTARIGVGDNAANAANNQTGLQAPTNKAWGNMANGYPAVANQTVTFQSSFDANTANFGWQEFSVVNAANDSGQNLNRVANNQGTKAEGQVWTLSVQITLS